MATLDTGTSPEAHVSRGGGRRIGGWIGWSLFVIVLAAVFIYPVLMLFFGAVNNGLPGSSNAGWSLDKFVASWTSKTTYVTLLNSLIIAVAGTVVAVLIGALFAWVTTSTNVPGRRALTPIMILSLLLPPLFYGFGWIMLANEQTGLLNLAMQHWFGVHGSLFNVESWTGLIMLSGLGFSPFTYLLLVGAFQNRDQSLDEASRISGASMLRTLFKVTLPSIAPALTGVITLTVVLNLQSFDVPQLIGRPAGIFVFSTEIYRRIYDFSPSDYGSAYSLSIMILAVIVILFIAQKLVLGNRNYATLSGKGFRREPQQLGAGRYVLTAIIVLYAVINLVLPAGAVLLGSLEPVFGVFTKLTFDNFVAVFQSPDLMQSLQLTALLSVFGGLIAMCIALLTSYVVLRRRGFLRSFTSLAVWMPWAMPGIVLALAYLWIVLSVPALSNLYGTAWLMLIVLVIATIPLVSRIAEGALAQISPELEEAARIAGARPARVFVGIVLRLVIASFGAGWFLSALFISGNLAVPAMLASPVAKPVASTAYELFASGQTSEAAALFLIILVAAFVVLAIVGGISLGVRARASRILRAASVPDDTSAIPPLSAADWTGQLVPEGTGSGR
jgi:ABC-type Fe3+ transport system, permease component